MKSLLELLIQLLGSVSVLAPVAAFVLGALAVWRFLTVMYNIAHSPIRQARNIAMKGSTAGRANFIMTVYALFLFYNCIALFFGFPANQCVAFSDACRPFMVDVALQVAFVFTILTLIDWNVSDVSDTNSLEKIRRRRGFVFRTLGERGLTVAELVLVVPLVFLIRYFGQDVIGVLKSWADQIT